VVEHRLELDGLHIEHLKRQLPYQPVVKVGPLLKSFDAENVSS
jgi:hypothetical protein